MRLLLCLLLLLPLTSCTIVRHGESINGATGPGSASQIFAESFNATNYVEERWDSHIIPEFTENAVELTTVISELQKDSESAQATFGKRKEETSPFNFLVKGVYPIAMVDTESSSGTITLDVADITGNNLCTIQIGPVIKKSSIRDALDFIQFGDFNNQIEFANISREINFYVRDNVIAQDTSVYQAGETLSFYGAFTYDSTGAVVITPVSLEVQ